MSDLSAWTTWLAMGGYAGYVWGALGFTLIVLAMNVLLPWLQLRALRKQIRQSYESQEE
ncbi:MAG: heme exporter protein CcmD [Thiofilum sp.]|uniref:heme exporter protein CcmD n=1 Tax=Thiofilum sp. TaxID=2212733 RepID=UPI0025D7536A|nr:heme exporter protein CcmD [Thiofilum sp.]MBK8453263.1 heme exporter protein CcmD [Thiofilum sp.]